MNLYLARVSYLNGKYWSREETLSVKSSSIHHAGKEAIRRMARPKGTRIKQLTMHLEYLGRETPVKTEGQKADDDYFRSGTRYPGQ